MDTKEIHAWSRHWDTLFWAVTSILTSANLALLAYSHSQSNSEKLFCWLGLALTLITVYFAASFRWFRSRLYSMLPKNEQKIVRGGGLFPQWWPYIGIFVAVSLLWIYMLYKNAPDQLNTWITLGIVVTLIILVVGIVAEKKCDNAH